MYEILKTPFCNVAPAKLSDCYYEKSRGSEWLKFNYYSESDDEIYYSYIWSEGYGKVIFDRTYICDEDHARHDIEWERIYPEIAPKTQDDWEQHFDDWKEVLC